MTKEDKQFLNRINKYADEVLNSSESQNARVSFQLDKLKPVMEEIAAETGESLESVLVRYMDLTSERSTTLNRQFKNSIGNRRDTEDDILKK